LYFTVGFVSTFCGEGGMVPWYTHTEPRYAFVITSVYFDLGYG